MKKKERIAIFASGTGSNAKKIIEYFSDHEDIEVVLVLSNKSDAPVLEMAESHGIPAYFYPSKVFLKSDEVLNKLKECDVTFVVLAGFLLLVPQNVLDHFPEKIVNIHPALLPKYGGKGMYGHFVHEAVWKAKETETGITIHFVNERYDEGMIIKQVSTPISEKDDVESIRQKVQLLEHQYFAPTIETLLLS